jgi:outer membrane protein TolC
LIRLDLFVLVLVGGCATSPPEVDAERAISAALGDSHAVAFRFEGAPLDAANGSPESLGAAEAIRRAVETSPELQAALARVRAAQAEADLAGLLPNPVLSLVLRFPEGGGKTEVEAGLGADLLAILQRPRRARTAGHRLEAAAAEALSSALDVVARVQRDSGEVQALEALLPVLEGRAGLLERQREVAQARLELGEGSRPDVTAFDAERTRLAVETAERRRDLRVARLALARTIGEPSSSATWRLDAWSAAPVVEASERAWIDSALARRPEILAIEWELRAREEEEGRARGDALSGANAGLEAERDELWSVGPSVAAPLPVFDTGQARRERARALTAEQRHRLTEARRGVVEDVRSSLESLGSAQRNLARVESELIPLQERRRAETEEAYRLGLLDVTALLFADQALQESQARRVDLAREVAAARTRLERSVGGPAALELAGGTRP